MTAQLCSSIAVGFVKSKSVNYSHLCVRSLPGTDGRSDHLRQHAPPQLCGVEDDVPFDNVGVRGIRIGADRDALEQSGGTRSFTGIAEGQSIGDRTPC